MGIIAAPFRALAATRTFRWSLRVLLVLALVDLGYLVGIWPQWERYAAGPVAPSNFMQDYEVERRQQADWPPLRFSPVEIERISTNLVRAVIVAEDARFYEHEGVDIDAVRDAMEVNIEQRRFAYGASTISQQTVKNLFLSPSRNPLRKWHELVLTIAMERQLSKERILEHYLNVAEFGRGIYGAEAAARHYWGIPASALSERQAIELAATLPSPASDNPVTRTAAFDRRVRKIRRYF